MLLALHVPVLCADTICGVVSGILLDAARRHVAYVLVQQLGLLGPERLVPPSAISAADARALRLRIDEEALIEYDVFDEPVSAYRLEPEPPTWTEAHMLRHAARVLATDGPIGRVGALALNPDDWTIEQIILRRGHLWGARDIAIPMSQVAEISEFTVSLSLSRNEVEALAAGM